MQRLDHLAGGDPAPGAFRRHPRQFALEGAEPGDLLFHIGEMTFGQGAGLGAGSIGVIRQIKQGADRIQIEAQLATLSTAGTGTC